MIRSIFTRDKAGTSDAAVGEAPRRRRAALGNSVPTGTYLDMMANLSASIHQGAAPVLIVRGEYDGIATDDDWSASSRSCPTATASFVIPGMAHSLTMGVNRHQFWYVMQAFLNMPPRQDVELKNELIGL